MARPHRKPPRTGAEARFRRWVDRQLKANPDHLLNKILRDETTGKLRSNAAATVDAEVPGYDAGHTTTRSYKALDGNEFFSVEDPLFNRGVAPEEKLGFSFQRDAVDIQGIPVDRVTAQSWENLGYLPPGTVANAAKTLGWGSVTGYGLGATGEKVVELHALGLFLFVLDRARDWLRDQSHHAPPAPTDGAPLPPTTQPPPPLNHGPPPQPLAPPPPAPSPPPPDPALPPPDSSPDPRQAFPPGGLPQPGENYGPGSAPPPPDSVPLPPAPPDPAPAPPPDPALPPSDPAPAPPPDPALPPSDPAPAPPPDPALPPSDPAPAPPPDPALPPSDPAPAPPPDPALPPSDPAPAPPPDPALPPSDPAPAPPPDPALPPSDPAPAPPPDPALPRLTLPRHRRRPV